MMQGKRRDELPDERSRYRCYQESRKYKVFGIGIREKPDAALRERVSLERYSKFKPAEQLRGKAWHNVSMTLSLAIT